jgi:hypothetical protein
MGILNKVKKATAAGLGTFSRVMKAHSYSEEIEADLAYRRRLALHKGSRYSESLNKYEVTSVDQARALNIRANQLMHDPMRRAIYSVNSYMNIFGIPRPNFWKADNDRLARNAIYAVCEKRIMDTVETVEWDITDANKESVESAVQFLKKPNPQQTFQILLKQTIPDILRYDQACWVKTRSIAGKILELKAYSGPEFWIEVDNHFNEIMGQYGLSYFGPWSHGYVKRYWQHSKPGIYIPFAPKDVCFLMMYPRSDSIYGTDFIQQIRWQLEYLIDSTKAAGMTFANGVGPSMVWKHPDLNSIEQLEERGMEVELENKGPENFGNILHLIGQEDISTIFPELMNMQWLEGQKLISSIVWAMFGFSASEFTGDDVNRATAYINQNITKSKMLAPLLRHLETVINDEVLPELDGYQEGWTFAFKPVIELDDKIKEMQYLQTQAQVVKSYVDMSVPLEEAMRLAEVEEEHITSVTTAVNAVSKTDSMEAAYQRLLQVNNLPPNSGIGNAPDSTYKNPLADPSVAPPSGPHREGYKGIAENDSGRPEDDGQPKNWENVR